MAQPSMRETPCSTSASSPAAAAVTADLQSRALYAASPLIKPTSTGRDRCRFIDLWQLSTAGFWTQRM